MNRREVREVRHNEAVERTEAWQNLTLIEQLRQLDARLGKGVGAVKQRAKIQKQIDKGR